MLFHKITHHSPGPPEKPRVYTVDDNKEVRLKLGPYRVGETVRVRYIMTSLLFMHWIRDVVVTCTAKCSFFIIAIYIV